MKRYIQNIVVISRVSFLVAVAWLAMFTSPGLCQGGPPAAPDTEKITAELFQAAEKGDYATVKSLLTKYPDMKTAERNGGWTLLHMAFNNRELVEYLIAIGLDIDARSDGQWTPLHSQAYYGHTDGVELLIEQGADIEAEHAYAITPLLNSVRWDRIETARLLVEKGANVNAANTLGRTPLILCAISGYVELSQIFLKSGADTTIKESNYQRTALHFAALNGHPDIVAALLKKGAEVNETDGSGKTALDLANRYAHERVAKLLKSSGAHGEIDPRNFGHSPWLKKDLPAGGACAWYMGRAGYAVKTQHHFLLFSYSVEGHLPEEPRLCNGHIDLAEIADCDTIVFAAGPAYWHHHPERYRNWQKTHRNIDFVYSFEDKVGRNPNYFNDVEGPDCIHLPAGEKQTVRGVKVETIPVAGLGPGGSGFVVEADGVVIVFGGDHLLHSEAQRDAFRQPIDNLKGRGIDIDLLILPGNFMMGRIFPANLEGLDYAVKTLQPRAFLVSGGDSTEFVLQEAAVALDKYKAQTAIFCPEHRGDMFILNH